MCSQPCNDFHHGCHHEGTLAQLYLGNMDGSKILRVQLSSLFRLQSRSQMLRRRVERQLHDDRQFVFPQQLTQHAKATWPTGLARILVLR